MVQITLPSNDKLDFEGAISGLGVAERISKSLAKSAIAIEVDGVIKDLSFEISKFFLMAFGFILRAFPPEATGPLTGWLGVTRTP